MCRSAPVSLRAFASLGCATKASGPELDPHKRAAVLASIPNQSGLYDPIPSRWPCRAPNAGRVQLEQGLVCNSPCTHSSFPTAVPGERPQLADSTRSTCGQADIASRRCVLKLRAHRTGDAGIDGHCRTPLSDGRCGPAGITLARPSTFAGRPPFARHHGNRIEGGRPSHLVRLMDVAHHGVHLCLRWTPCRSRVRRAGATAPNSGLGCLMPATNPALRWLPLHARKASTQTSCTGGGVARR